MRTFKQIISGQKPAKATIAHQRKIDVAKNNFKNDLESLKNSNRLLKSMSEMIILNNNDRRPK